MNRALLSAIALCFAAGCDKPAEPPKPKTAQAVVPLSTEAPKDAKAVLPADTKGAAPKTGATKAAKRPGTKGCGNGKCVMMIKSVTPGKPYCTGTYNVVDLDVAGEGETITWHVTGGWTFDTNGIDLPIGSGQFSNPQGTGTNKYSVVDANTDTRQYKYKIRLVKGKDKCVIDPSVVNGAETIDPNYPPP